MSFTQVSLKATMKATTVDSSAYWANSINYSAFFMIFLDYLSDPFCYKTLSHHFHKSATSIQVIISINLKINMYQVQKNELSEY